MRGQSLFGVPDSLGGVVGAPVHVLTSAHCLLTAHVAEALRLQANQEGGAVQEEHVLLPVAGVVVSLSVDRAWHGPDCIATHFF
jgi:hypothetical protein